MSAAEELKALAEGYDPAVGDALYDALPQIVAVVEAAENAEGFMVAVLDEDGGETYLSLPIGEWLPVVSSLAALDEQLGESSATGSETPSPQ